MKIIKRTAFFSCLSLLLLSHVSADPISFGAKVGTLGLGVESSYRIDPLFSLTGSVNGFQLTGAPHDRDVDFDGKLHLLTAGGSLGVHPFKNGFKILAGVFYDGNQFNLSSMLRHNVTIDGKTFTPAQVGKPGLIIHFNRVSPYLGIGFDSAFCTDSPWSLTGELGVLFQGSPKVNLKGSGEIKTPPQVQTYIKQKAKHAADKFLLKYYPVLSIGVKYNF
ncbi:MAG: hypothetical protein K2Y08_00045 [Alphaproteobacteria bacterium]|nr:hypothetical protein [Alphaproteobacteria bacterium]